MMALRFAQVTKSYGRMPALVECSLDVRAGEFFGLIGVNGAGKTTLIKCLLDFCDIDRGSIEIFGVAHRLTAARGRLAFLPERFNPPFYLTGRDFLQYMSRLHRVEYDERSVERLCHAIELDAGALAKPARTYSKGMTQKLGLAACLLSAKDLYVLDEPATGLDPRARALFKRELIRLRGEGRTVFFSSHALGDVEELCDRLAVIHEGRLKFAGTPVELRCRGGDAHSLEQAFLECIAEETAPASGANGRPDLRSLSDKSGTISF